MASNFDFEMAQALRRSHCDRKDEVGHKCVGEMAITSGEVKLSCQLCGAGEQIINWNSEVATILNRVFGAAGINWDSLVIESKIDAIQAYLSEHRRNA